MSISALGGSANPMLQRVLREAAERTLADEQVLLGGEAPASASALARGDRGQGARALRRRATSGEGSQRSQDEAIVVDLHEQEKSDRLEVAGGWITTAKPGPGIKADLPASRSGDADGPTEGDVDAVPGSRAGARPGASAGSAAQPGPSPTARPDTPAGLSARVQVPAPRLPGTAGSPGPAAQTQASPGQPATGPQVRDQEISLDRLLAVLKQTGISFRDAYQVLREINAGAPLPPKAELHARWTATDPDAWETREHTASAPTEASVASRADVRAAAPAPAERADPGLRQTPVDDLIRDRDWHRAHTAEHEQDQPRDPDGPGLSVRDDDRAQPRPTLQTIVRHDGTNQAYIAALSTAEFQRLVTVLGGAAPAWFWDLRGHRGVRGWAERPTIARLNTTRIAGTRLGAWLLAAAGAGALWAVGAQTGSWW
jgi:hypothetical protein